MASLLVAGFVRADAPAPTQTPAPPAEAELLPADLRPKFTAGRVSRYQFWRNRDQVTRMQVGGESRDLTLRMTTEGQTTWKVERVAADGSCSGVMTIDWIVATVTGPDGRTFVEDSRKSAGSNAGMHRLLKAVTGTAMPVDVNADGSIARVSGAEEVARRAGQGVRTPDALDLLESATDAFTVASAPARAELNTAWKADYEWNHEMGKMAYATTYRLVGVEEIASIPVATIAFSARLRLSPDMSRYPAGGPRVSIRMTSGTAEGQIMQDLQRGELVGSNTYQQTVIEAQVAVQNQTFRRTQTETIQSQGWRIAEE